MRIIYRFTYGLIAALLLSSQLSAYENLDELEARTSRKGTNTFYSGEDASDYYHWQPGSIIYKDTTRNHEVWLWYQSDAEMLTSRTEWGWMPWSADGKRFSFNLDKDTAAYSRTEYGYPYFVVRSDGTQMRPTPEDACRASYPTTAYFKWSPVEPDVYYHFGCNENGNTGLDENTLYKHLVSDDGISRSDWVDVLPGDSLLNADGSIKRPISGDGRYLVAQGTNTPDSIETEPFYILQIYPPDERGVKLYYNQPALDTYWLNSPGTGSDGKWHDEHFTGNSAHGYWIYILYTTASYWRMRPWGSDGNAPNHVTDRSAPYTWWDADGDKPNEWDAANQLPDASKEVQPVNGRTGNLPNFSSHEWIHPQPNQWGTHMAYTDWNSIGAPAIWDVENSTVVKQQHNGGNMYITWDGWTDWAAGTRASEIDVFSRTSSNSLYVASNLHLIRSEGDFAFLTQSPDGTKIASISDWLSGATGRRNIFITVAYYPYPPEIRSVHATGGVVRVTFDWATDGTSRGYTTLGWPDVDSEDPPPPREIAKFRLWKSPDMSTWTPIGTVNHNIFSRYDFSNGSWNGDSHWTITEKPGDGTWYYAVTSIEWSGLESRTLSNIYSVVVSGGSGTGSQNTAYPASPGDIDNIASSDFYTSYNEANSSLVRYYNIYAEDGSEPTVSQQNLIASIPKGVCSDGKCTWVDWLGSRTGTTQYAVTVVDTQGNEGGSLSSVTATHRKPPATSAGQYTIEWFEKAGGIAGPPQAPRNLRVVD